MPSRVGTGSTSNCLTTLRQADGAGLRCHRKVSEVWVNGVRVAAHNGMFGEVRGDFSALAHPGDNVVAVHIIPPPGEDTLIEADKKEAVAVTVEVTEAMLHSLPHGMYPASSFSAGIWQPVRLEITDPVAVAEMFARPRLDGGDFDVTVRNASPDARNVQVEARIVDAADGTMLHRWDPGTDGPLSIPAHGDRTITLSAAGLSPKLWSPAAPNSTGWKRSCATEGKPSTSVPKPSASARSPWTVVACCSTQTLLAARGNLARTRRPPAQRRGTGARVLPIGQGGHVTVTRAHRSFSETWMQAADEMGMAVSMEGTWPW